MDDLFHKKVRSAAVAGWWTLLVAVGLATVAWGGYLAAWRCRPAWASALWGGASWETIQTVALWAVAIFKVVIWTLFLVVVWLTIWSAKLKRLQ